MQHPQKDFTTNEMIPKLPIRALPDAIHYFLLMDWAHDPLLIISGIIGLQLVAIMLNILRQLVRGLRRYESLPFADTFTA